MPDVTEIEYRAGWSPLFEKNALIFPALIALTDSTAKGGHGCASPLSSARMLLVHAEPLRRWRSPGAPWRPAYP